MKLRNKKTGETARLSTICVYANSKFFDYGTLAELNKEWEDYGPVPKISDAEWRCIVRKWYKLNDLRGLIRVKLEGKNYSIIGWREGEDFDGQVIDIPLNVLDESIVKTDKHTIAELCGEEHEED